MTEPESAWDRQKRLQHESHLRCLAAIEWHASSRQNLHWRFSNLAQNAIRVAARGGPDAWWWKRQVQSCRRSANTHPRPALP